MKTNKSFSKRIKVTRTGKILARKPGFNHFNAKQKRTAQLAGRKLRPLNLSAKVINRVLPHQNTRKQTVAK
jgi:ribosomal protein L35